MLIVNLCNSVASFHDEHKIEHVLVYVALLEQDRLWQILLQGLQTPVLFSFRKSKLTYNLIKLKNISSARLFIFICFYELCGLSSDLGCFQLYL